MPKKINSYCIVNATIFAVLLNLLLPFVIKPFATPEEISPPNGSENLNLKQQVVHMLVHHAQVPFSSSLIIILIVSLSIALGYKFKPVEEILKLLKMKKVF